MRGLWVGVLLHDLVNVSIYVQSSLLAHEFHDMNLLHESFTCKFSSHQPDMFEETQLALKFGLVV